MDWPADHVERRSVASLVPYARNARTHSAEQIEQIAASVKEWGWTMPVLIDEAGGIIAGHGRVLAAQKLRLTEVPVMVAARWSDAQKRAYIIADNKIADNAGWDDATLKLELGELNLAGFELGLTGFGSDELKTLFSDKHRLVDPDEIPPPPKVAISRPGDLWFCGEHRVLCGDATSAADVKRVNDLSQTPMWCLTDPPYGIGDSVSKKHNYHSYDDSEANLRKLVAGFFPLARAITKRIVLTPGNGNQCLYPEPTWTMAWFTPAGVGRGPWGFACWQPILCYGKDPKLQSGKGCFPDAIVHTESSPVLGHPCAKPINFWTWLLRRASTETDDAVYDPFLGSGTTLIAAEMEGRRCLGLELDPVYVDVIVQRWQTFTGNLATLEGAPFAEVAAQRAPALQTA